MEAYLRSVKEKTGKTWQEFRTLAKKKGLTKHGDVMTWLKADFGLGHGHANAIAHMVLHADDPVVPHDDLVAKHFAGGKAEWRKPYDALMKKLNKFGPDVTVSATKTYLSLLRNKKKFAIVQVTGDRLDLGIKLKGEPAQGRFKAAGDWNAMVTHRVQISDPKQIDAEVLSWLKQAYEKA